LFADSCVIGPRIARAWPAQANMRGPVKPKTRYARFRLVRFQNNSDKFQ